MQMKYVREKAINGNTYDISKNIDSKTITASQSYTPPRLSTISKVREQYTRDVREYVCK